MEGDHQLLDLIIESSFIHIALEDSRTVGDSNVNTCSSC